MTAKTVFNAAANFCFLYNLDNKVYIYHFALSRLVRLPQHVALARSSRGQRSRPSVSLVNFGEQCLIRDTILCCGILDSPEARHLNLLKHVVGIPAI